MLWTWYDAKVVDIQRAAPQVKRLFLEVQTEQPFVYKAGQFVTLDLPISDKRLQRWRSYSIASACNTLTTNVIELCVVRMPEGKGSTYLCEQVAIGDTLRFKGADGTFHFAAVPPQNIVLIGTGTGVAPLRAMLQELCATDGFAAHRVHLIFGTRTEADLLYADEFRALAEAKNNFKYDIALSRQQKTGYYEGHLHQIYEQNLDITATYYICGWKNMIDEAVQRLTDGGVPSAQIHYELYG